jgi:Ca2+-binding RTX toxin-like protein
MPTPAGRRLLIFSLAILAILVAPSAAIPAAQIVIYGAEEGTHMTLSTKGDTLVVKGHQAETPPKGCHFTVYRQVAACNLNLADSIEIQTGQSGDFVRVLDPLPVPVTAYTGAGSDKFYGNSERDTCYTQGDKKNRCVGKGGNDTCITGQKNSDCIGNGGDDYCEHGAGSDGCWGGPGNDVCKMGPGKDGCHGEEGNDRLYGGEDGDQLYGGPGYDYCDGEGGLNSLHGCEAGPGPERGEAISAGR